MNSENNTISNVARAFTLLEVLVTIAIIGVLLAIVTPALTGVRSSAQSALCLSNQRVIGGAFAAYAAANKGKMPIYQFTRDPDGVIRQDILLDRWAALPEYRQDQGVRIFVLPTDHAYIWGNAIRRYLTDEPDDAPFVANQIVSCPVVYEEAGASIDAGVATPGSMGAASYLQSAALFTRPAAWLSDQPVVINREYEVVPVSSVDHPSRKALLTEHYSFHGSKRQRVSSEVSQPFNVLAIDGHAARQRSSMAPMGERIIGERAGGLPCSWCNEPAPFMTTKKGVAGVDW